MHDHVRRGGGRRSGPRRGGRPPGRGGRRRGIVLPIALALLFVLLTLALGLAEQGRAMLGFTVMTEAESLEIEANEVQAAYMQGILQGEASPGTLGLPAAIPFLGGAVAPFQQPPDGPLEVFGQFNGGLPQVSGYNVKPLDQPWDSYTAGGYYGGIHVPYRYVSFYSTARYPNMPSAMNVSLWDSDEPYGILAPNGTITVNGDAWSVHRYRGDNNDPLGSMVNLASRAGVTVTGFVNGNLIVQMGPTSTGAGSSGGIRRQVASPVGIPDGFKTSLATARAQMASTSGLVNLGTLIDALHTALHRNIPTNPLITGIPPPGTVPVAQLNEGSTDINSITAPSGTDLNGGTFDCGVDFTMPSGGGYIPYSCHFARNLALMSHTVLIVQGDLTVDGNVYMSELSSLVVGGRLTVNGRLDMANQDWESNRAAIAASSDVVLPGGMQHTSTVTLAWQERFGTRSNPFSDSILSYVTTSDPPVPGAMTVTNPNNTAFNALSLADFGIAQGLDIYLQQIMPLGSPDTAFVPGALLVTDGSLTVGGTKMAGLGCAAGPITVTSTRTVGALWSQNANVVVGDYRFYPYHTHAYVHSGGTDSIPVASNRFHRTAYGRLRL